jgi:hypothetical protein
MRGASSVDRRSVRSRPSASDESSRLEDRFIYVGGHRLKIAAGGAGGRGRGRR